MTDRDTIAFYDAEAERYAGWSAGHGIPAFLRAFAAAMPPGGSALDLGCGGGWAARWLQAQGFAVTALDASAEMVRQAGLTPGITAIHGAAETLDMPGAFDGIWSHCALQHLPATIFPDAIARAAAALKPGGRLFLALHEGDEELRDGLGRFYCHHTEAELRRLLAENGLHVLRLSRFDDKGYDGRPITVMRLDAVKKA